MNHPTYVVFILSNLAFLAPGTYANDWKEQIVSDIFHTERDSLRNLLKYVTQLYFGGCTTAIVYSESYAMEYPELLQNLIVDLPSTYIHKCVNNSSTAVKFIQDSCYNYIVFIEHLTAINGTIARQSSSRVVVVSNASSWTVFSFLRSPTARMYTNLLIISRSTSKQSKEGSFVLYTHKLYTDGIGSSHAVILTSWINTELTRPGVELFPPKLQAGFNGHQFLVSAIHKPPFSIRNDVSASDQVRWDGIDIRTIKLIGERLNFTTNVRDPKFEMTSTTSPVNAITSDIASGRSSIGLGGVYRTTSLMKTFDTLFPHDYDCAAFASLGSTALPRYRAVLGPFQPSVWAALACAYLIAIIPLTLSSEDITLWSLIIRPKLLTDMFWFVFGTFTNCFTIKGPVFDEGLKKKAASILIGLYWVFTIITTSCYTGSIIAFITLPVYPVAMDTSKQLLSYRYRIGTLDHDGWESWFVNSDDPVTEKLLRNVELVPSVREGVKNASRAYFWRYAFLGSKTMLEYKIQADFSPHWITKRSIMHISKECFVQFGVTAVIPRESLFTEIFSKVVQRAWQSGLIEKIKSDVRWDVQRSSSGNLLQVTSGAMLHIRTDTERQLTLDDMQGMFTVLGAGVLIGLVTLISECIFSCCNKNHAEESDAHSDEPDTRLDCLHLVNIEEHAADEYNRILVSKNARCSI